MRRQHYELVPLCALFLFLGACQGRGFRWPLFGSPTSLAAAGTPTLVPLGAPGQLTEMGELEGDVPQRGSLEGSASAAVWSFRGAAERRVVVTVSTASGKLKPFVELYDENANLVAASDSEVDFEATLLHATEAERSYRLLVRSFGDGTGIFEVRLLYISSGSESLEYDESVVGLIAEEGGENLWTFQAERGDLIEVNAHANVPGMDLVLEVVSPSGDDIARDDDSGGELNPALQGVILTEEGEYSIRVRSIGGDGLYELELVRTQTLSAEELGGEGGAIEFGEDVTDFAVAGEEDAWTFEAQAGDVVEIGAQALGSGVDLVLRLTGPDGDLVAEDDDSGGELNPQLSNVVLPNTGTHSIRVSTISGNGRYQLDLQRTGQVDPSELGGPGGVIEYGQTVSDYVMSSEGDEWTFSGRAGDVVTITMSSEQFDSYLELEGAQGDLLASNDDGGGERNSLIEAFSLPETGEYTIIARAYSSGRGSYTMTLTRRPR